MNFPIPFIPYIPSLLSLQQFLEDTIKWANKVSNDSAKMMMLMANKTMKFGQIDADMVRVIMENITGPVGFIIMVVVFLTSFLSRWKNGNDVTMDDIAKPVLFLIIADVVLTHSGTIAGSLMGISNQAGDKMLELADQIGENEAATSQLAAETNALSIIGLFLLFACTLISLFVSFIASAVLYVILISAKVEMMLRFAFSPIGFSYIADESRKDDVFRYFKKLLACVFYIVGIQAAILYCCKLGIGMAMSVLGETGGQTNENNENATLESAGGGGSPGTLEPEDYDNSFIRALLKLEVSIVSMAMPFAAIGMVSIAKNVVNDSFGS